MRVILSNGRQFIIKIRYSKEFKHSSNRDEFNRMVFTEWTEYNTMLTITEWFPKEKMSRVTITGYAHCHYQDTFNKETGKSLAYLRALNTLEELKIINAYEEEELAGFKLDRSVYKCTKVKNSIKVDK